ncbi:MAG: YceI family protein [Bacteroidia bacterium]
MKKISFFLLAICLGYSNLDAQIYVAKKSEISFFSVGSVANVQASNKLTIMVLSTATNDIQMKISIKDFIFPKPLMQEHFNEDYMESDKFPSAVFKGKINEKIDYTQDGTYTTTTTGTLDMHGVQKTITISGLLTIKSGEVTLATKFKIHLADYKIKVPSYVGVEAIAADIDVNLNATLDSFKK